MIRAVRSPAGQTRLTLADGDLRAWVDRDWVGISRGDVPGFTLGDDGVLRWAGREVPIDGLDPDESVRRLLLAALRQLEQAVAGSNPALVQVIGGGLLAHELRRRLGAPPVVDQRPAAVVETTGSAEDLVRATRTVADGGLIVLAGEPEGELELNLYPDVHRRGLRLVALPELAGSAEQPRPESGAEEDSVPDPAAVSEGEPLPPAEWYVVRR